MLDYRSVLVLVRKTCSIFLEIEKTTGPLKTTHQQFFGILEAPGSHKNSHKKPASWLTHILLFLMN